MTRRKSSGRNKSIFDFIRYSSSPVEKTSDVKSNVSDSSSSKTSTDTLDVIIRELAVAKKKFETNRVETSSSEKTSVVETSVKTTKPSLPVGEVLDEILEKGLGYEDVTCNSDGKCTDGLSIGEVFTDKYGFRRKRGFVNTTRLPVFLDWIVEEGTVREIMPKTFVLETNLGSKAIIPEDYICEFQYRYGLIIKNYDKCIGYKPSIIRGESEKKRKK